MNPSTDLAATHHQGSRNLHRATHSAGAARVQLPPATTPQLPSMVVRSTKWLATQPGRVDVRNAISAITNKLSAGTLQDDEDVQETLELLTEYFVEQGGDLCDLPGAIVPVAAAGQGVSPQSPSSALFDPSPLCPDISVAGPVLSDAEKRRVFDQLRGQLSRPGLGA